MKGMMIAIMALSLFRFLIDQNRSFALNFVRAVWVGCGMILHPLYQVIIVAFVFSAVSCRPSYRVYMVNIIPEANQKWLALNSLYSGNNGIPKRAVL